MAEPCINAPLCGEPKDHPGQCRLGGEHGLLCRPATSFDLNLIAEVRGECDPPKANALLADGWTLLAASIDTNGFPAFVLGRPVDDDGPPLNRAGFRWLRFGWPRPGEWYDNGIQMEAADGSWRDCEGHRVQVYEVEASGRTAP